MFDAMLSLHNASTSPYTNGIYSYSSMGKTLIYNTVPDF